MLLSQWAIHRQKQLLRQRLALNNQSTVRTLQVRLHAVQLSRPTPLTSSTADAMPGNLLDPSAPPPGKARQIQEAKACQKTVQERAARRGATAPAYEFLELTGKGAYGRVYKW